MALYGRINCFRTYEVHNIRLQYISIQNRTNIIISNLSVTYFQSQIPLLACFYSVVDRT